MAETVTEKKTKKKKSRPTNCAQSNKRIHRADWYYRNGRYFANKQCFKLFQAPPSASAASPETKKA